MNPNELSDAQLTARRNKSLGIFAAVAAVVAVSSVTYWNLVASRYVSTDNAYTNAEVAAITPAVGGIVREVLVSDTQKVKAGDLLLSIDPVDAQLALQSARAGLEQAIRRVKSYQANDRSLGAQVLARDADLKRAQAGLAVAQADYDRAKVDFDRRTALVESGSVSGDELTQATNAFRAAEAQLKAARAAEGQALANLNAAKEAQAANTVWIADADIDHNPDVMAARARLQQAEVDLARTELRAPVDGIVAKRQVQVGQRLQPGMALMVVVPVADVYVDANFKEVQLADVRVGQSVELHSDLYGDDVVYRGVVEGFSGGSGSAFAAIPAQNATGNWIKVVQRLPVRIRLDKEQLAAHPLKVGLSMAVEIDLHSGTQG
ncbi:efflux RND transporter periplasmic adaptor subunit [Thalassolituus sp. LLYu03]|uniref:HlyD family secretion protein n=1 Tax=Thalassolituus sp. LLYu03 TaxID=3421656 RepID=UPI003D2D942B